MRERRVCKKYHSQRIDIAMMKCLRVGCIVVLMPGCMAGLQADDPQPPPSDQPKNAKRLLALHLGHAEEYEIFRNSDRREKQADDGDFEARRFTIPAAQAQR